MGRKAKSKSLGLIYAIPVAAALGMLVLCGRGGNLSIVSKSPPTTYTNTEPSVKDEKTSFETAKKNGEFRQQYLDQIFEGIDKYGVEGWTSFAGFVYDSDYELVSDEFGKRTGKREWRGIEGYSTLEDSPLMVTPRFGMSYVKLSVFVSKYAFEFASSQDELLSLLDNEAFTAYFTHTQRVRFSTDFPEGLPNPSSLDLILEVYSFEQQFFYIENGRRDVSVDFVYNMMRPAQFLYWKVEELAALGTIDAPFAQAALNALEKQPTNYYFKYRIPTP